MARIGLVVTTNYQGIQGAQLAGPNNDGDAVEAYLRSLKFDEVARLREGQATRQAIEDALEALVVGLDADDLLVFHYAGHGTEGSISLTPGAPAIKHEGLVPHDFRTSGILWDERLRQILAQVARFARVVVILDSCFSGGMFRFAPAFFDRYAAVRFLPPEVWLRDGDVEAEVDRLQPSALPDAPDATTAKRAFVLAEIARVADQQVAKVDHAYPVVLLAASKAGQVAWCAERDGVACGAFTTALLEVAQGHRLDGTTTTPPKSYLELMYGSRDREGITSVRVGQTGWLPAPDAQQDPTLHGTPGRVRWPLFAA